jgi:uncharacterized protein DUF2726
MAAPIRRYKGANSFSVVIVMISTAVTDWSRMFDSVPGTPLGQQGLPDTSTMLLVTALVFFVLLTALWSNGRKRHRRGPTQTHDREDRHLSVVATRPSHLTDLGNPLVQLEAISTARFERKPLLNRAEARLLPLLEATVSQTGQGHRVMVQTCMGEVLRPLDDHISVRAKKAALASIDSKRLDFAIVDQRGLLVCALEYQGSGHYLGTAVLRDAVKREVLRRAGVPFIEVPDRFDPTEIEATLLRILTRAEPDSEHRHATVHV